MGKEGEREKIFKNFPMVMRMEEARGGRIVLEGEGDAPLCRDQRQSNTGRLTEFVFSSELPVQPRKSCPKSAISAVTVMLSFSSLQSNIRISAGPLPTQDV